MDTLEIYKRQLEIAQEKFRDILINGIILYSESGEPLKLRLDIIDGSIVDVFCSARGKYSYHWEKSTMGESIYRHDNAPHKKWKNVKTFPKHFHKGSDNKVVESSISDDPFIAIEQFLNFVRDELIRTSFNLR
jgi:hypothetical protein